MNMIRPNIIGASARYIGILLNQEQDRIDEAAPAGTCQHQRVLHGGGLHFGDDLCTCVDCGLEKYEESFPATRQTVLRKRQTGPRGVYEAVSAAEYDRAPLATAKEAPLFGACS